MPWFIWMCFLIVPPMVGVAVTLASDKPDDPKGINTVAFVCLLWLFVAYHLKNYLKRNWPNQWVRWWVTLSVVLPIVFLFFVSLKKDPLVASHLQQIANASKQVEQKGLAPAAPAARALTWAETRKLLARMLPYSRDYSVKLLTSVPPAWWFIAFGVGLWRGKNG